MEPEQQAPRIGPTVLPTAASGAGSATRDGAPCWLGDPTLPALQAQPSSRATGFPALIRSAEEVLVWRRPQLAGKVAALQAAQADVVERSEALRSAYEEAAEALRVEAADVTAARQAQAEADVRARMGELRASLRDVL